MVIINIHQEGTVKILNHNFHNVNENIQAVHNINSANIMESQHYHDCYEILFIMSDNHKFIIDDEIYLAPKGSVFIIEPYVPHMNVVPESKWYERYALHIKKDIIKDINQFEDYDLFDLFTFEDDKKAHHLILNNENMIIIEQLLKKQIASLRLNDYAANVFQRLPLMECLFFLLKLKEEGVFREAINDEDTNYKLTTKITNYIKDNLSEDMNLDCISKKFYRSKSTINRLFKKYIGTTVNQFISSRRVYYASELLENGTPVFEVCNQSGFNDYNHFIRTFKKYFGRTPKQYQLKKLTESVEAV